MKRTRLAIYAAVTLQTSTTLTLALMPSAAFSCSRTRDYRLRSTVKPPLHQFGKLTRPPKAPKSQSHILSTNKCLVSLRSSNSDDESSSTTTKSKAKVRFSTSKVSSPGEASNSNLLDSILSWISTDVGSVILGFSGLIALLVGRLLLSSLSSDDTIASSPDAQSEETRANLLAVFATGAVLLNGISKLDVESALAPLVELSGQKLSEPVYVGVDESQSTAAQIGWTLKALLAATPAQSAVLLATTLHPFSNSNVKSPSSVGWQVVALAGIVPSVSPSLPTGTAILDRFRNSATESTDETYLPTLQALPGRTEFTYLPPNTQAVLLVPVRLQQQSIDGRDTVTYALVLGGNRARVFTPKDISWCQSVAQRLGRDLSVD